MMLSILIMFFMSFLTQRAIELVPAEMVGLENAQGRMLAEDIVSGEAIPPFTRSLVDGYAVKAKDTVGAKRR